MTKTQRAIQIIEASARQGMAAQAAAAAAEAATGLRIVAQAPLTPQSAGQGYYDSHARHQRRARFVVLATRTSRVLADEFVGGFTS